MSTLNKKLLLKSMKQRSVSALKKKLWKLFSEFVRRRDGGKCFTCGKKDHWKRMQAGHYISRTCSALLFSENNVHVQCARCNIFLKGNLIEYRNRLVEIHGDSWVELLESHRRDTYKWTRGELDTLITYYEKQLREMGDSE